MAKHANKNNTASLLVRSGLAIVFLYAAVSSLVTPQDWIIYLPHFATAIASATTVIKVFAVYELVLAGLLISGRFGQNSHNVPVSYLTAVLTLPCYST